jgi:hypothetical protein
MPAMVMFETAPRHLGLISDLGAAVAGDPPLDNPA